MQYLSLVQFLRGNKHQQLHDTLTLINRGGLIPEPAPEINATPFNKSVMLQVLKIHFYS